MFEIAIASDILPFAGTKVRYPFGPPPEGTAVLWRCEAKSYAYIIDADSDLWGSTKPGLELYWYEVQRWTKTGARLVGGKLVFLDDRVTNRQWASRTPEQAIISLYERRKRQISILSKQLERAQKELALAEIALQK